MWILPVLLVFMLMANSVNAQVRISESALNHNPDSVWITRIKEVGNKLMGNLIPHMEYKTGGFDLKSPDSVHSEHNRTRAPFIQFMGGQLQYTYNYQSQIDTPLYQPHLSQHIQQVRFGLLLGDFLPVQISYFGRNSNSVYFRDFYDVRVDIDARAMRERFRSKLIASLAREVDSAKVEYATLQLEDHLWNFNAMSLVVNSPNLMRLLIESEERLLHIDEWNTENKWQDSARKVAAQFLKTYQLAEEKRDSITAIIDSVRLHIQEYNRSLSLIRHQLSKPDLSFESLNQLQMQLAKISGRQDAGKRIPGWMKGLDRISIGRTLPHISQLTTSNINIRGINMSYTGNNWFSDLAFGLVDFRLRDYVFINSTNPEKQWVLTGKFGWGKRQGTYFALAGYHGRKQVYGTGRGSDAVNGLSAEFKWQIARQHHLLVEVAQSGTVGAEAITGKSTGIDFSNRHSRAYFATWRSTFPKAGSSLEGRYQKLGIHFQSFNSFRINAATESWSLAYSQDLWRNRLRFRVGISQNDMSNSLIPQRFATNSVLKTAALTFRKRNWPVLSLGWMPARQIVVADSTGYELNYQSFTGNASYEYKVGIARFASQLSFSWFDLAESDIGFMSGQTRQVNFLQYFRFPLHNAVAGFSNMISDSLRYRVFQVGSDAELWKSLKLEAGCRIHNFNRTDTRAGFYGKMSWNGGKLGLFTVMYDDMYLPSVRNRLYRNQQVSISYIKNLNQY